MLHYRCVAHTCIPNCVGLVRPVGEVPSNAHRTHGKDPSDARIRSEAKISNPGRTDHATPGPLMDSSPPRKPECKFDFYRKVAGEDGTDEAEPVLLTGQGEMDAMCESSASVSPTQLVSSGEERGAERGGKRRCTLARNNTLPRRQSQQTSPQQLARSWSTSQEF